MRISFKVRLEGDKQNMLKPNLSVPVSVVIGEKQNALYLPDGAAFKGAKVSKKLFVVSAGEAKPIESRAGYTGGWKVEILSGLKEGDRVIISDMENYKTNQNNVFMKGIVLFLLGFGSCLAQEQSYTLDGFIAIAQSIL